MAKSKGKILVVDDNSGIRAALKLLLPMHFTQVEIIPSPVEIISRIADFQPDVVLLDMNFHTDINTGNEGLYWLSEIKKRRQDIEVVLFTAYADIKLAVEGMKRGAFDFIVKPWENDKLVETLENAYRHRLDATGGVRQEKPAKQQMMWGHGQAMTAICTDRHRQTCRDEVSIRAWGQWHSFLPWPFPRMHQNRQDEGCAPYTLAISQEAYPVVAYYEFSFVIYGGFNPRWRPFCC